MTMYEKECIYKKLLPIKEIIDRYFYVSVEKDPLQLSVVSISFFKTLEFPDLEKTYSDAIQKASIKFINYFYQILNMQEKLNNFLYENVDENVLAVIKDEICYLLSEYDRCHRMPLKHVMFNFVLSELNDHQAFEIFNSPPFMKEWEETIKKYCGESSFAEKVSVSDIVDKGLFKGILNEKDIIQYEPVISGYFTVEFSSDLLTEDEKKILLGSTRSVVASFNSIEINFYVTKQSFNLICERLAEPEIRKGLIIEFKLYDPTGKVIQNTIYDNLIDTAMKHECGNHAPLITTLIYSKKKMEKGVSVCE